MAKSIFGFDADSQDISINWCPDGSKTQSIEDPLKKESSILDSYFQPTGEDVDLDLFDCLGAVKSPSAGFRDLKDYLSAFGNQTGESLCSQDPLEFLKTFLTRENFSDFEQKFMDSRLAGKNIFPEDLLLKLRQHGRELFGLDAVEKELETKFGLEIESENFSDFSKNYVHHREPVSRLVGRLKSLGKELSSYPRELLAATRLRQIALCAQLDVKNSRGEIIHYAGYAQETYFVYTGDHSNFQHEFFHCLDYADGLSEDDVFYALGSHGPDYDAQSLTDNLAHVPRGFLTRYGVDKASEQGTFTEDQADVPMWLTGGFYRQAMETGKKDPVIAAKILAIKRVYYAKSNALMDERYWQDIERGVQPDEAYWTKKRREKFGGVHDDKAPEETVVVEDRLARLAHQLFEEKLWIQAARAYEKLLGFSPENGGYHERLGRVYFEQGEKKKALEQWELAVQYGVRSPEMFRDLGKLYESVTLSLTWLDPLLRTCASHSDAERVIASYEILLQRAPHNTRLWEELAVAWVKKGELGKAWQVYETRRQQLEGRDESQCEAVFYFYARFLRRVWPDLNQQNRDLMLAKLLKRAKDIDSGAVYYGIVRELMEMGLWYEARGLVDLRSEKGLTDMGLDLEKKIQAKLDEIECR